MKKIALLMDGWKRYFTFAWPAGLLQRIQETKEQVNLYIFNSSGNWSQDEKYNQGEYNIFRLPDLREFDGIILDLNNVEIHTVTEEVVKRAKESGVPVISIGSEWEGFYYVGLHNEKAMEEIMGHLVVGHGCRSFWFVMGPEKNYENYGRVNGIQAYLDQQGIAWEESDFYYENYEYQCGVNGFRKFLQKKKSLPDAIVCANDNIAVGVCEEAAKYGYHAPEDFLITGFDNFDKAAFYTPRITTVSHVREEVGYRCGDLLLRIWQGEKVPKLQYTNYECKFGESCGCGDGHQRQERDYLKNQIIYQIETDRFLEDVLFLEYELLKCSTFAEMVNCIPKCLPLLKCDAMYLVLDPKLNAYKEQIGNPELILTEEEGYFIKGYPEKMKLEFSYEKTEGRLEQEGLKDDRKSPKGAAAWGQERESQKEGVTSGQARESQSGTASYRQDRGSQEEVGSSPQIRNGKELKTEIQGIFPAFENNKPGVNLLFLPLHFRQWTVGYLVIRNAVYLMEKQYLHHVMGALTKAMENLHRQEKLEWMNQQLSVLYVRDTLTGMYNRMGYRKYAEKMFADQERKKNLLILFIDLDRLKYINDNFGHDMGDLAIRAVSDAIASTLEEGAIPVRLGGDEFLVIREELPAEEIWTMIEKIRTKVKRAGEKVGICQLSISAGYVVTDCNTEKKLEDYVNEADEMMYREKTEKKAVRKE